MKCTSFLNLNQRFDYESCTIICEWEDLSGEIMNEIYLELNRLHPDIVIENQSEDEHDDEDELFQVIKGRLEMHFRDRIEIVNEGEIIVVPKGVEHKPIAKEEVHIVLFEPLSIKHTGDIVADITVETYESI